MKVAFYYLLSHVVEKTAYTIICITALVQEGSRLSPKEELGGLEVLPHGCPCLLQEMSSAQGTHFFI